MTASPYHPRPCAECPAEFTPRRHDQVFCSPACKLAAKNRAWLRGRQLYLMAYHWVLGNGRGARGGLIGSLSSTVRKWRDEDVKAGRKPPPLPEILTTRAISARMLLAQARGTKAQRDDARGLLTELGWAVPKTEGEE